MEETLEMLGLRKVFIRHVDSRRPGVKRRHDRRDGHEWLAERLRAGLASHPSLGEHDLEIAHQRWKRRDFLVVGSRGEHLVIVEEAGPPRTFAARGYEHRLRELARRTGCPVVIVLSALQPGSLEQDHLSMEWIPEHVRCVLYPEGTPVDLAHSQAGLFTGRDGIDAVLEVVQKSLAAAPPMTPLDAIGRLPFAARDALGALALAGIWEHRLTMHTLSSPDSMSLGVTPGMAALIAGGSYSSLMAWSRLLSAMGLLQSRPRSGSELLKLPLICEALFRENVDRLFRDVELLRERGADGLRSSEPTLVAAHLEDVGEALAVLRTALDAARADGPGLSRARNALLEAEESVRELAQSEIETSRRFESHVWPPGKTQALRSFLSAVLRRYPPSRDP